MLASPVFPGSPFVLDGQESAQELVDRLVLRFRQRVRASELVVGESEGDRLRSASHRDVKMASDRACARVNGTQHDECQLALSGRGSPWIPQSHRRAGAFEIGDALDSAAPRARGHLTRRPVGVMIEGWGGGEVADSRAVRWAYYSSSACSSALAASAVVKRLRRRTMRRALSRRPRRRSLPTPAARG